MKVFEIKLLLAFVVFFFLCVAVWCFHTFACDCVFGSIPDAERECYRPG